MNDTQTDTQKTTVIKGLAIIGFIVALVVVAWLAVQAVRLIPTAFRTLASIADGLKSDDTEMDDFAITTGANVINTGETLTVSWTPQDVDGIYTFSYQCTDGVVAELPDDAGNLSTVVCDTPTPVSPDDDTVAVIFSSEKRRFVDVPYAIGFAADETDPPVVRESIITVVNPGISAADISESDDNTSDETNIATSTPLEEIPNTGLRDEPEPPLAGDTADAQPSGYTTVPVVTTTVPVSNPNGYTDLSVTFIGVGTYDSGTKTFTPRSSLEEGERGALQFAVKNIGTKTSDVWYFSATLPTDPDFTYRSNANASLKPNERQVVTLQFDNTSTAGTENIIVSVTTTGETITANNSLSKTTGITN